MSKLMDIALFGGLAAAALYWPVQNAVLRSQNASITAALATPAIAPVASEAPPFEPLSELPPVEAPVLQAGMSRLPGTEPIETIRRTTLRTNHDPMAVRVSLLPGYDAGAHARGGLATVTYELPPDPVANGALASSRQP